MSLDEILELWNKDCRIDSLILDDESLNIPKLHNRYFPIYIKESLLMEKMKAELNKLKLEKYEFFTGGMTKETKEKGWKMPAKGAVIKSEVPMYLDADENIIEQNLKVALQKEKVDFLKSILSQINDRKFQISNSIKFKRFQQGLND